MKDSMATPIPGADVKTPSFRQLVNRHSSFVRKMNLVRPPLKKFLGRYPHYGAFRQALARQCEMTCTACAIIGSAVGSKGDAVFRSAGAAVHGEAAKESSLYAVTAASIAVYSYVSHRTGNARRFKHKSALMALGYATTLRVFRSNHSNGFEHVLHEFIFPLLSSVYDHFLQHSMPQSVREKVTGPQTHAAAVQLKPCRKAAVSCTGSLWCRYSAPLTEIPVRQWQGGE